MRYRDRVILAPGRELTAKLDDCATAVDDLQQHLTRVGAGLVQGAGALAATSFLLTLVMVHSLPPKRGLPAPHRAV